MFRNTTARVDKARVPVTGTMVTYTATRLILEKLSGSKVPNMSISLLAQKRRGGEVEDRNDHDLETLVVPALMPEAVVLKPPMPEAVRSARAKLHIMASTLRCSEATRRLTAEVVKQSASEDSAADAAILRVITHMAYNSGEDG